VREPLVEHILAARIERGRTARSYYLKAIAIELDFISPCRSIGQWVTGRQSMVPIKLAPCLGNDRLFGMDPSLCRWGEGRA
jgi:hypothetical protein